MRLSGDDVRRAQKVLLICVDGLDADLLRVYGPSLPHLRRLMLESPFLELQSCFPPETAPAWASLYTGQNPAQHGILQRVDYLGDASPELSPRSMLLKGETFWDRASEAGKRVCVINPALAYPAWPVNGVMLSLPPVATATKMQAHDNTLSVTPASTLKAFSSFPPLLGTPTIPTQRRLSAFCASLLTATEQQVSLGLELFKHEPWDLFMLQLNALDILQHFLWRYSDPSDPTYPGHSDYANCILDFYHFFDSIIGCFRASMEPHTVLMVVSAYGHGRRPLQRLNLNEWLRSQGLLTPRTGAIPLSYYLLERTKYRSMELLAQLRLHDLMPIIARHLPGRGRQLLRHTLCGIDQQATIARVAEIAAGSPFGGIYLNQECIEEAGLDYESVRESLLEGLRQLRWQRRPMVNWAKAREEVYSGQYLTAYPDLLFELQNEFGVSGSLHVPLITSNPTHRLISGDHRMQGVLLLGNVQMREAIEAITDKEPTVMDVAPMVLSLLSGCAKEDHLYV